MLTSNLEKIAEHGKRADGIVRRSGAFARVFRRTAYGRSERAIDEALNLAYHGARAQDQSFNIALERDFGEHRPYRGQPAGHHAGVSEHLQQWLLRHHEAGA